jgi:hypothetical protein
MQKGDYEMFMTKKNAVYGGRAELIFMTNVFEISNLIFNAVAIKQME